MILEHQNHSRTKIFGGSCAVQKKFQINLQASAQGLSQARTGTGTHCAFRPFFLASGKASIVLILCLNQT